MKLDEHSLDAIQRIIEGADANRDSWELPKSVGDTALRQAEIEGD